MSRVQARHRVIAVVTLTLVLAGAPAVWAAPRSKAPATTVGAANWFDSAAAWLGGLRDLFAGITPTGKAPKGPGPDSVSQAQTGSCIDPLGGKKCSA
ncbi:MAG TPA: hypothetical protein VEG34_08315 [Thermoanaerobaculia bacterium]|nr:hypothetical protein [Thermoanaerobaculia bacterium]